MCLIAKLLIFAQPYFKHISSSPHNPQENGQAKGLCKLQRESWSRRTLSLHSCVTDQLRTYMLNFMQHHNNQLLGWAVSDCNLNKLWGRWRGKRWQNITDCKRRVPECNKHAVKCYSECLLMLRTNSTVIYTYIRLVLADCYTIALFFT